MALHRPLHGHARSPLAPSYPPQVQALADTPSRLTAALASALCRLLGERRSVERAEVRDGFVFVYTTDPAMRQFIAVGTGEWLNESVMARFAEIAEFNPQFFNVLYLGRTDLNARQVEIRSREWNEQKWAKRELDTMQAMLYVFQRLQNVWHSFPLLLRDTSDVGEYVRRTAAFELRERLVDLDIDQENYTKLAWSILRFAVPTCIHNGRTFFAYRDIKQDTPYLLFDVNRDSKLRKSMDDMGLQGRSIRFDLTLRDELDREAVKTFGQSLARHAPAHPGFILSRRSPSWDFEEYARDLRLGHKHAVMVMRLSDRELLQFLENGENKRFIENERILIELMRSAYWAANKPFEYQVECESFDECSEYVVNTLDFGGLTAAQISELADSRETALTPDQIRRNWHLLSVDQKQAAHRFETVFVEADIENVCSMHGSDSVNHDG